MIYPTLSELEAQRRALDKQIAIAVCELTRTVPFALTEYGWQFTRNGRVIDAIADDDGAYSLFEGDHCIASGLNCSIYDVHAKIATGGFDHTA